MKIVFMGTPDFAVPTLTEIIGQGHEVVSVYTRAPAPAGRGMELRPSPVQVTAERCGIPVFSPKTLKNSEAAEIMEQMGFTDIYHLEEGVLGWQKAGLPVTR